ncbi:transcription termination factor NusA [Chloroflexota bacterium]
MKSDFLIAITQLAAEKNLSREIVVNAVESALASAYKKEDFAPNQEISVKLDPNTGKVEVWAEKTVVELPADHRYEISLIDAQRVRKDVQLGETIKIEATPHNAGRIAAQTAKQVILQRLHEAEHSAIFEEYADKEEDIVIGFVQRIEPGRILVDLGRTEAVLPAAEQVRNERYRVGQRIRVYLLEVVRTGKGPQLVISRSHPNLLRRLFELEVPEVLNGIVEVKSVAREAGYRSKVAVTAKQEGIDPVGCCVGLRGIRIQNIVNELSGEKIDIVIWHSDATVFIANALSPAQISNVELNEKEGIATVVVPDRQLSLAIGKEGQNARLAAKLTGWRIDIKSASVAEEERLAEVKDLVEAENVITEEKAVVEEEFVLDEEPQVETPVLEDEEEGEALPSLDSEFITEVAPEPEVTDDKPQIRFAEDILAPRPTKAQAKTRKVKKKGAQGKSTAEDNVRTKRVRRESEVVADDEEY